MAKQYTPKENNARAAAALTSDPMAVVPPQAVELEEAVLGALMLEKDAVIEVQGLITPEAFYNEAHQIIYKAIVDLSMELKPIDLYTVTEKLKQIKKLTAVGGPSYLAQLTQKVGSAAHVEFHARISSRWTYFWAMILAWNSTLAAEPTFWVSCARYEAPPTFLSSFLTFSRSVTV